MLIPAESRVGPPLPVPVMGSPVLLACSASRPSRARSPRRPLKSAHPLRRAGARERRRRCAARHLVLGDGEVDGVPLAAARLLGAAILVLLVNVVAFALLYLQVDGGGPAGRVAEQAPFPDLQFPQTGTRAWPRPDGADPMSGTTVRRLHQPVAFSPTDTLPLTPQGQGPDGAVVDDLSGGPRPSDQHPARVRWPVSRCCRSLGRASTEPHAARRPHLRECPRAPVPDPPVFWGHSSRAARRATRRRCRRSTPSPIHTIRGCWPCSNSWTPRASCSGTRGSWLPASAARPVMRCG
jgi:hypothetical protein